MSSKTYTNVVLTCIAVLFAINVFKGSFNLPFETEVQAQFKTGNTTPTFNTGFTEFKFHFTSNTGYEDAELKKLFNAGWKPITIAQTVRDGIQTADITVLLGR